MKRFSFTVVWLGAVALLLAVGSPVEAACTSDRTFGTYPSAGACGYYCYVFTDGDNTSSSVKGFYWVLGQGPTRNSGGYEFDGTGGSQPWFIPGSPFANGWSLTTTVNNGQTVGCPAPDAAVWVFSDSDGTGGGLYALSAADENLLNFLAYDLGIAIGSGGKLMLQPLPSVSIVWQETPGDDLIVTFSWTPNGELAFQTSSATITDVSQVLTGWRVYKHEVTRGSPPPTTREVDDWDLLTVLPGPTTNHADVTFRCDDPSHNEAYLAVAPDLDSGFITTYYVGGISTRIECDPNIAEPGPRPRKPTPNVERKKIFRRR